MEQAVSRDPTRAKARLLKDELMRLERQQHGMSEELDGPQLSAADQRQMLLQKVTT